MKWQEDLLIDIRTNTPDDDNDFPFGDLLELTQCVICEFSIDNRNALQHAINLCKNTPRVFVEIGVHRNGDKSSTHTVLKNLPQNGVYLGIDIEDKTFIDDPARGIHTIKTSSSNYDVVVNKLKELGCDQIDFLFIDGWHSINQVLDDWEYTRILSPGGVVAFHDTAAHPGPHYFMKQLNRVKWHVSENVCPNDNGFGYCYLRAN